jgi:WD40 repeat protein
METILHISFNQDGSCFCLGTKKGFFVYNTSPLKMLSFREFNEGINIVEMLKKTNILALVEESDKDTDLLNNKLIIWDDHQNKRISELKLDSEILNVKIKLDKIIVSTNNNYLYLIEITTLEINSVFQMYENSNGLFAVSMDDKILVVAFPYKYTGYVKIKKFNSKENIPSVNAHDTNISFLTLSNDGNLLATSSERGTLIRIFSAFNGEMIQELRRGAKTSLIYHITFDMNNKFLACSSSSGTVHIFSIYSSIKYLKEKGIFNSKSNNLEKKETVDLNIN